MKFSVSQSELNQALSVVSKGISSHSTLPILSGILLKLDEGNLVLQSTDLDTSIEYVIPVLIEEEGSVVVPAKLFSDIVRSLPDAAVYFETKMGEASIMCENSSFSIRTMDAVDFPGFPQIDAVQQISLPFNEFATMVKRVAKIVSRDESRAVLTGVLISVEEGKVRMVATDSYRIAVAETKDAIAGGDFKGIIAGSFLGTVAALPASSEDITISLSENQAMIKYRGTTFINRVIEGNYPNYKQLLPSTYTTRVVMSRGDLLASVKRTSLMSGNTAPIKFDINVETQTMSLYTLTQDVGAAQDIIKADVEGESLSIGFNFAYILDGLGVVKQDEVSLEIQAPTKPGIFKAEADNFLYLVMPVRLSF